MADRETRSCRHCDLEIEPRAKVCPHCSRAQHPWVNLVHHSVLIGNLIALVVVGLAGLQYRQASEANSNAQAALDRAGIAQKQAETTCRAVKDLAEATIRIADVIPRTTAVGGAFQTGELSAEDKALLKKQQDLLKAQMKRSEC